MKKICFTILNLHCSHRNVWDRCLHADNPTRKQQDGSEGTGKGVYDGSCKAKNCPVWQILENVETKL